MDQSSDQERVFLSHVGGAPYDCRWKALTSETFETMAVLIALRLSPA